MTPNLKALLEKPHTRRMWSANYRVRPKVLDEVFGDGGQLVCLTPVNTRPQYYIVQVDSGIVDLNSDAFRDLLDGIYEALENQFGSVSKDDFGEPIGRAKWPELDDSLGSTWGGIKLSREEEELVQA